MIVRDDGGGRRGGDAAGARGGWCARRTGRHGPAHEARVHVVPAARVDRVVLARRAVGFGRSGGANHRRGAGRKLT